MSDKTIFGNFLTSKLTSKHKELGLYCLRNLIKLFRNINMTRMYKIDNVILWKDKAGTFLNCQGYERQEKTEDSFQIERH